MKNSCPLQNQRQTPNLMYQAEAENEVNNEKKIFLDLLQRLLKNGLEIIKKISTTSNTAKILSYRNIHGP